MAASLLVSVRSLVIDAVAAMPEFADAEVSFGYKVGSKKRVKCWTGNAAFNHAPAGMRAVKSNRDENATFNLIIVVEGIGMTPEDTAAQALTLGLAVEDWAATHANGQGTVTGLNWLQIEGDGTLLEAFNDLGCVVELTYPFAYRARLT